jgi:hypothetical protein
MPQLAVPLAITAALAAIAGAGMSFYGQQQQAAAAGRMAQYNYATQKAQAEMQAAMAAQQAEAQAGIAGYNASIATNEALRAEQEARERARRIREDNQRLLSTQRAAYGKSGIVMEGTPLSIMADTAAMGELTAADAMYEGDSKRGSLLAEAAIHRYQQQFSATQASAHRWSGANAGAFAAPILMQGRAQASSLRMSSYGSLIQGVGGAAGSLSSVNWGGGNRQIAR